MNKFRIIVGLLGAFFILTGCYEDPTPQYVNEVPAPDETILTLKYDTLKLSDGRYVDCARNKDAWTGGITYDCNWATLRNEKDPS